MTRLPDWNLEPPEDDPEMDPKKRKFYREELPDPDDTPFDLDKECDYWERVK